MTPKVGIFWFFKGTVIGHFVPIPDGQEYCAGLIDSPMNHSDSWDEDRALLTDFPKLRGQEYFRIPRGRVVWNKIDQYAIVYMDSTLFNDSTKALIRSFFELNCCEVHWKKDSHYTTDPDALDVLFDNDV